MATDSSSGTLPPSSRVTIDSSSSIARSKLSFLTSTWVFSAILRSRMPPQSNQTRFLRAYCGGDLAPHQCGDVGCNRLFQPLQVVAALQHRHHPAAGAGLRDIHQLARNPAEILGLHIERGQRIAEMRVETGGDDDEFGAELPQLRQDQILERGAELDAAILGCERRVDDGVVFATLTRGAGAGKQRHLVRR